MSLPNRWDGSFDESPGLSVEWHYGTERPFELTIKHPDGSVLVARYPLTGALALLDVLSTFVFYNETGPPDETKRLRGPR